MINQSALQVHSPPDTGGTSEDITLCTGAVSSKSWEQPISLGEEKLSPFPSNCLPETVREYVEAVAESVQVPVDMAAVALLVVIALCVQKKFVIEGKKDWREPLNLFALIVAPPAERKSAVMETMTKFVYEYEREKNKALEADVDSYRTQRNILAEAVKVYEKRAAVDSDSKQAAIAKARELSELEEVHFQRLLADDCTPEGLASLLAENNGKMAVISAEGGIFEILNGRYTNGVNIDVFLKAHAGDAIRIDRKSRESEYIPHPGLSVLLAIQPVVLEGLMDNNNFRGRGLTARFLYSIPTSKVGAREFNTQPVPKQIEAGFKELLYTLLDIPFEDTSKVIHLSPKAQEISSDFAADLEPRLRGDLETIGDWAGKLHGAILRIAGILHVIQNGEKSAQKKVTGDTMEKAIAIGCYFLEHAQSAYRLMGANPLLLKAKSILRQLEKERCDELPQRDLFRKCRGRLFKIMNDFVPALDLLAEYGYIQLVQQEYKGVGRKPDILVKVNPSIYN